MFTRPRLLMLVFVAGTLATSASAQGTAQPLQKPAFGGPESIERQLENQYDVDTLQRIGKPWFDWKQRVHEEHGLKFGAWASLLYAEASDVGMGDDDALGSILRFQGSWDLVGRGTPNTGGLQFRIEHRTAVGGYSDPGALSGNVGAGALNTGFPYSDSFDTDLAVVSWKQIVDDRWGFDVGRLAFDVYLDAFFVQTTSGGFLNRGFVYNPTIAATGIGALGAVVKGYVTDNVWLGGQAYDANAVNGEFDLDTIEEAEFLTVGEIGWTPDRARSRTDRVQLSYWYKDARDLAGAPSGSGWAVSASWKLGEVIPFTRFGSSDGGGGAPAEEAFALGVQYQPAFDHSLSLGYSWADVTDATFGAGAADESVLEASWKWQVSPNFSIMPDAQFLEDPATNPGSDSEWIASVRAILSF